MKIPRFQQKVDRAAPKQRAQRALRKHSVSVAQRLEQIGCDPITLLALYALGDVVTLGLMTREEYKATAELVVDKLSGRTLIVKKSGMQRAAEIIPVGLRVKCATELAQYVFPKRSAIAIMNPDGSPLAPNPQAPTVVVNMPENGRRVLRMEEK